jgi:dynein heavy chain
MLKAYKKPNVLDNCNSDEVLKKFQENNKILDKIQKMLEDYLEKKRRSFPRFYFLSNDELIEILSQTRNPHAVQPH